jgi:hypothetical protein
MALVYSYIRRGAQKPVPERARLASPGTTSRSRRYSARRSVRSGSPQGGREACKGPGTQQHPLLTQQLPPSTSPTRASSNPGLRAATLVPHPHSHLARQEPPSARHCCPGLRTPRRISGPCLGTRTLRGYGTPTSPQNRQGPPSRHSFIEVVLLPRRAPERNPDEYLNHDMKGRVNDQGLPHDKEELRSHIQSFMRRLLHLPEHVISYLLHPLAQYAAAPCIMCESYLPR